ncbi:MAG: hypothetical protein ACI4PZ_06400 [Akkermansia sp.]
MRQLLRVLSVCWCSLPLWAASDATQSADAVGVGEFPALQLLPPGSEIEGISLPRYENHRISALLQAERLCIVSRREVELRGIRALVFNADGTRTEIDAPVASYDFTTLRASAADSIRVCNPRFEAWGGRIDYDTEKRRGFLLGPVRTTISTSRPTPPERQEAP